jgi:hypothetical protein
LDLLGIHRLVQSNRATHDVSCSRYISVEELTASSAGMYAAVWGGKGRGRSRGSVLDFAPSSYLLSGLAWRCRESLAGLLEGSTAVYTCDCEVQSPRPAHVGEGSGEERRLDF